VAARTGRPVLRAGGAVLLLISLCTSQSSVQSAEFAADLSVQARLSYTDNLSLTKPAQGGWGFNLGPTLGLSRRTETNQLRATAGLGFNRYTDPRFNTVDAAFSVSDFEQLEQDVVGIVASYNRQSYKASQLQQTGLNLGWQQVSTLAVSPQWTRALTEQLAATLTASYAQARYDRSSNPSLTDYWTAGASLGLNYAVSERTTVGLTASYNRYDTSPFTSRSESWGATGSATYLPWETVTLTVSLGAQHVRTEQAQTILVCPVDLVLCQLGLAAFIPVGTVGESDQLFFPYSLSARWQISETETAGITASQQLTPNGTGSLLGSKQFGVFYSRALSPTLTFTLPADYTISTLLNGARLGYYATVAPLLSWQIDEAWSASAGYIYQLTYGSNQPHIDAHTVFATISYSWPLAAASH